jgi:hypothetical protein
MAAYCVRKRTERERERERERDRSLENLKHILATMDSNNVELSSALRNDLLN